MSAVLSRDLSVQYKTALVLTHKLRAAMAAETVEAKLSNTVEIGEIGGAYFGEHVRPANFKGDRVDRWLVRNRADTLRVVIALRERRGRTLTRALV